MKDHPAMHHEERIRQAMLLWNTENIKKAVAIYQTNPACAAIRQRIIDNVEQIMDRDLYQDNEPALIDLRKCGEELYDIGGFVLMKTVCDATALLMAPENGHRTKGGNRFAIASLCNGKWDGIGEWVS